VVHKITAIKQKAKYRIYVAAMISLHSPTSTLTSSADICMCLFFEHLRTRTFSGPYKRIIVKDTDVTITTQACYPTRCHVVIADYREFKSARLVL
jgi:hypothetical protein